MNRPAAPAASLPVRQRPAEEPQPVPAHDPVDVLVAEPGQSQGVGHARQVGGGGDLDGDLVAAQAAVHVGADSDVAGVAGQVADVACGARHVGEGGAALAVLGGGQEELV